MRFGTLKLVFLPLSACLVIFLWSTTDVAKEAKVISPLAITGDVKQIKLSKEDKCCITARVTLGVHFLNRGSVPVLLFVGKGYPLQGNYLLAGSRDDALHQKYLLINSAWPSSDRPAWQETRGKLDQAIPPEDLIRVIKPAESWDFDTEAVLSIEIKGSFDKTSKPWDTIRAVNPLWLQVNFLMWPNNLEKNMLNPKFGRHLQQRWKDSGQLVLENITSQPISMSLPANEF